MQTLQLPGTSSTGSSSQEVHLRRHSVSEPSLVSPCLLLDSCLRRTASLHVKLDQLTDQIRVRSRSQVADTAPDKSPVVSGMVCHGCHGEIGSGAHIGSATGKNLCRFLHSPYCQGGVVEDETWRACPQNYVVGTLQPGDPRILPQSSPLSSGSVVETSEQDLSRFQRQANGEGASERRPTMVYLENEVVEPRISSSGFNIGASGDGLPSAVEEQVRLLRAHNQEAQNTLAAGSDDVQLSIADIRKLPDMQGLVGDQMKKFQETIPALAAASPASQQHPTGPTLVPAADQHKPEESEDMSGELARSEAEYRELLAIQKQVEDAMAVARNEQHKQQQQMVEQASYQQLGAAYQSPSREQVFQPVPVSSQPDDALQTELFLQQKEQQRLQEALAFQKQQYNNLLAQQQQQAALLAAQKLKFEQEQRAAKLREQKEKNARVAAELREAQQALAKLQLNKPSPLQPPSFFPSQEQQIFQRNNLHIGGPSTRVGASSIPVRGEAEAGDLSFTPEYDFFRRPDGTVYKVLKMPSSHRSSLTAPVSAQQLNPPPSAQASTSPSSAFLEWRVNQQTGVPYQVLVQPAVQSFQSTPQLSSHQQQQVQQQVRQQPFRSPQFAQTTDAVTGPRVPSVSEQLKEKMAGIVSLVESRGEKDTKNLKLLDHVRSCPAKWAKKVTLDNMNLPAYAYGVTAELTASLSGRGPAMSPEVLMSKLQHLQNTFSVCCLNTTEKEFSNYGWVLARDYAMKVQDRVTQNLTSWESLSSEVQTSDLVASQMEFPRPVEKKAADNKDVRKPLCSTWNTSKTEKKCQYEVEHPGRTCQRKHECSHCRDSLNQSHRHQQWKCPNK